MSKREKNCETWRFLLQQEKPPLLSRLTVKNVLVTGEDNIARIFAWEELTEADLKPFVVARQQRIEKETAEREAERIAREERAARAEAERIARQRVQHRDAQSQAEADAMGLAIFGAILEAAATEAERTRATPTPSWQTAPPMNFGGQRASPQSQPSQSQPAASRPCPHCNGRGLMSTACSGCNGTGLTGPASLRSACFQCSGKGFPQCRTCSGTGKL